MTPPPRTRYDGYRGPERRGPGEGGRVKSYEIVAWAYQGALYCGPDCLPVSTGDDDVAPVFADEARDDICDTCGGSIL